MSKKTIVWLASYPKSGNTWLRAFLANLLAASETPVPLNQLSRYVLADHPVPHFQAAQGGPIDRLSPAEINRLRPRVQANLARRQGGHVLVKTHSMVTRLDGAPTISPEVTAAAIYVLRNPLDVAMSFANHFGATWSQAVSALSTPNTLLAGSAAHVFQPIGSWSQHVRSWCDAPGLRRHVMRYEDMVQDTAGSFRALLSFLKLPADDAAFARALSFSGFKALQAQEQDQGFHERPAQAERFFRKGKIGDWRGKLSAVDQDRLIGANAETMRRFGYLDPRGRPAVTAASSGNSSG